MTLNLPLKDKVAFITGSTRGIGWSIARFFAEQGAIVLLNGASDEKLLQERVETLKKEYGGEAQGFFSDMSDPDQVKNCYASIFKSYKRLDVLVNNAGVLQAGLLAMTTRESVDQTMDVNVKSVIYNMQSASRLMGRKRSGSIINMTSIMGRVGSEGQVIYSGSKAAIIGLTLAASKELAGQNIRVNAIAPGFIDTEMARSASEEKFEERLQSIRMKRIGTPEDVAQSAFFFASDLSTYVTGQVLGVDGGMAV